MKKHTSGLQIGLWIVGGLVGLYMLGYALLYLDYFVLKTDLLDTNNLYVREFLGTLYRPLSSILERLGVLP